MSEKKWNFGDSSSQAGGPTEAQINLARGLGIEFSQDTNAQTAHEQITLALKEVERQQKISDISRRAQEILKKGLDEIGADVTVHQQPGTYQIRGVTITAYVQISNGRAYNPIMVDRIRPK